MPWPESKAVGWLAATCLMLILMLHGAPEFSNASVPARGIADPVVALQMARNVAEVDDVLGPAPSPDREAMRLKQYIDFAFIAAYAGLYFALGRMFRTRLAWIAALLGLGAAVFDVFENLGILRIVNVPLAGTTPAMIDAIRYPSLAKWTLACAATAIFAGIFLKYQTIAARFIGGCDVLAAALGFYGLFDNAFLVWAGIPLVAGLIGLALRFARGASPRRLLKNSETPPLRAGL